MEDTGLAADGLGVAAGEPDVLGKVVTGGIRLALAEEGLGPTFRSTPEVVNAGLDDAVGTAFAVDEAPAGFDDARFPVSETLAVAAVAEGGVDGPTVRSTTRTPSGEDVIDEKKILELALISSQTLRRRSETRLPSGRRIPSGV